MKNTKSIKSINLKGKRVLDIGGHIGSFALKAISRNVDYVVSFEPNQENYDLLFQNLMGFEDAETHRLAITRSDKVVEVRFEACDNPINSGGGCSVTGLGEVVPSMSLDDAIDKWNPNVIKIDAEGAELEILKGFEDELEYINMIFIETSLNDRNNSGATHEAIVQWLRQRGFRLAEMSDSYQQEGWGDSIFLRNNKELKPFDREKYLLK